MENKVAFKEQNFCNFLKNYFQIDKRKTIIRKEIIGGISTFLAMAYILAVNPAIVGDSPIKYGEFAGQTASIYWGGLFLATAIASFVGSFVMGVFANIPIALAPGMGLNAFFAYNVATSVGFDSALTITMISGLVYFIIVMTPLRRKINELVPNNFKLAVGAAIGLFIAYLGLQNSGIIVSSLPLVSKIGDFSNGYVILAVCILLLGLVLHYLKVPGGIIITMVVGAILLAILISTNTLNTDPSFSLLGNYESFNKFGDVAVAGWKGFANVNMWTSPITYLGIFSFVYLDFFDTTGTLLSLGEMTKLDESDPKWFNKANLVDASCTVIGAAIGATTVTSFVESTVGVGAGARTGIASIVTALCFGISIALWPILQIFMPVPSEGIMYQPITGPILVIIGTLMISQLKYFDWSITVDIPMMFLTLLFMTLSNSIGEGLSIGIIVFVVLNFFAGLLQKMRHKKNIIDNTTISMGEN